MKETSFRKNVAFNFLLKLSGILFQLISFPYASRVLQASQIGKVAFATSIAGYFTTVAALGIPMYGIRACAQMRDDRETLSKTVQELLILHSAMTLVSLLVFAITIACVPRLRQESTLYAIFALNLLLNVMGAEWLYSGLEQYQYIAVRSVLFKLLATVCIFLFVREPSDYLLYGFFSVLAAVGSNLLNAVNISRYVDLRPTGNYHLRRHIRPVLIFFAQTIAITIYTSMDTVMLGFLKDDFAVGIYDVAVKCKIILSGLVTMSGAVLLPRLSHDLKVGMKERFQARVHKSMEFVVLLSCPMVLFFMLNAQEILLILAGAKYSGSVPVMQIISPAILLIGLSNVTGMQILTPMGREHQVLYSVLAGAVVNFTMNYMMIPSMGPCGAALGTVAAEAAVLGMQLWYLRSRLAEIKWSWVRRILTYVAAAMVPTAVLWLLRYTLVQPPLPRLFISAAIYSGLWLVTLCILRKSSFSRILSELLGKRGEDS